ncbi:unnamed protein product [Ambrosiozyma monospora]|uniref:Unnamed protein product n=1 Tax=Ambrosiozyma monospora TaxID=43982 RepID=A0ACB5T4G4_AMBMO|nr:unnamed protein product [Ambrosiozyma monospora]
MRLDEVEVTTEEDSDYKIDSLAKHVNTRKINQLVLEAYKYFKKNRRIKSSLFFCVSVKHAEEPNRLFKMNGLDSRSVSFRSIKVEREEAVNDFLRGKLPILFNVGVFTEGVNFPWVDLVFIVRPAKSQLWLTQMIGRGLRLHPKRKQCLIIDLADASDTGISEDSSLIGRGGEVSAILESRAGTKGKFGFRGTNDSELDGEVSYVEFHIFEGFNDAKLATLDELVSRMRQLPFNWIRCGKESWLLRVSKYRYTSNFDLFLEEMLFGWDLL